MHNKFYLLHIKKLANGKSVLQGSEVTALTSGLTLGTSLLSLDLLSVDRDLLFLVNGIL